ncbi:GNAT family N-acetyltransferase [Pseudomonas weihenstephanensis]|uniref:Protein ElaA n=1 Tax=Pseudomonas weihenstephanensis TaxID=1608994 RepID=A0A0J6IQD2_9PSED|nr:GNAT family N-acetyltransferase [Pseudomonas weihenstephanensis]KMN14329.1 acyltransferase [Pseudomonas weihenstephanensis]KMN17279.1 acyltransferase [Pseudomonas weihenstephanensis]MBM1190843.1 GNAT family N-acetyltransferase [Pseudomonas weihenstephanensis]GLX89371.1 GNAT family N-acetyltransferase [Pseudomonas fragi]
MTTDWICKHHSDLGKEQLYALLKLRCDVFIVEQKCAYPDIDGQDLEGDTLHVMGWQNDELVAYARLLDPASHAGDVIIGRVIVAAQARGKSLGHDLMDCVLENIKENWPGEPIFLSAQAHLQSLYAKHGFVVAGEQYLEDNIPHIGMRLTPGDQG